METKTVDRSGIDFVGRTMGWGYPVFAAKICQGVWGVIRPMPLDTGLESIIKATEETSATVFPLEGFSPAPGIL
jgi:hypothetical protein